MARIRTIKPEFFTSEDIVALSPMARLLYIACWCEADRAGRMEWKPGTMKLRYFPGDSCDMSTLCSELTARGLVVVYEVDRREYAEIPSFERHQIINNRESASLFPPRVPHACPTRQPRVTGEGRKEGKGGRVGSLHDPTPLADPPGESAVVCLPLADGTSHGVSQDKVDRWQRTYPAIDVTQRLLAMASWLEANPKNRKTAGGVERFIVAWLDKDQNRAPRASVGGQNEPWAGAI